MIDSFSNQLINILRHTGSIMRLDIVVDYNVEKDEFNELGKAYPLGNYFNAGNTKWFVLEIDGEGGHIALTWYLK